MYCIANLTTRTVLTNRAGDVIFNVNADLANHTAAMAQAETNEPHAVLAWAPLDGAVPWNHPAMLRRGTAPWLT